MIAEMALDLVIRFSTSNPDVVIPIISPGETTGLALKQIIRKHLSLPAAESRLRLIHSGKVLPDTGALSKSIVVNAAPPGRDEVSDSKSAKAKGKQPVRQVEPAHVRVYIHCSVGDALTPSELAAEATEAVEADEALKHKSATVTPISTSAATNDGQNTTTTPPPRGFDRLFTAGFTPAEVATLRSQFLSIQAHTHTPDTMPSGPDLLALEERWLDSGSNTQAAGAEDTGGFGAEDAGGLEDMLYGNLIGFFWPIGAMFWMMREEGVWTRRRQMAVLGGFLMNLIFGSLRVMN